jgi:hypothetical protein
MVMNLKNSGECDNSGGFSGCLEESGWKVVIPPDVLASMEAKGITPEMVLETMSNPDNLTEIKGEVSPEGFFEALDGERE